MPYSDDPGANPEKYYALLLIYLPFIVALKKLVLAPSSEFNKVKNTMNFILTTTQFNNVLTKINCKTLSLKT